MISDHASPIAKLGGADSGGQNVYVAHVSTALAKLGFEVDVFTRKTAAELPNVINWKPGIKVFQINAGPAKEIRKEELLGLMPEFITEAESIFRQRRYDIIHANFFLSGSVGAELKRMFRCPMVTTFHALGKVRRFHQKEADHFPPERIEIERQVIRDSDAVLAECPQDKKDLLIHYNAPIGKLRLVPCGVDTIEMHPVDRREARALLGLPQHEKIILQLGRLVPRKGIDTVILAAAELQRMGTDAKVVIVGGDSRVPDEKATPEIGRLKRLAADLGVADRIIFTGSRDRSELRYFYSAADVFVSVPWYEPFGITPLEAMACGTPVVGSNVGGIKYSVLDGDTGLLVPPKNEARLAETLNVLLSCDELRQVYSERGISRVRRKFTWNCVAGQVADVYNDVLSRTQRTAASVRSERIGYALSA